VKSLIVLTTAAVAVATLTAAGTPGIGAARQQQIARTTNVGPTGSTGPTFKQLAHARAKVRWNRSRTAYWRHRAGLSQINSAHAERRTTSLPFIHWINHKWVKHRVRAKWLAFHLPQTNDWETAVRIVQRVWPGSSSWLLACSRGEGGHSIWVWNGGAPFASSSHGSGAGSWMQYMSGTFAGHFHSAWALAKARHLPLPPPASRTATGYENLTPSYPGAVTPGSNWTSPLAVAFAAGWAHNNIDYHGPWAPSIDSGCA
jgi:hypothetical protein